MLVEHGADPAATNPILWGGSSPLCVAAENGQLNSLKYFVDELGMDLGAARGPTGQGVMHHAKRTPNWEEMPAMVACVEWISSQLDALALVHAVRDAL